MENVAGRIIFTFPERGVPEVVIEGKVNPRFIPNVPYQLRIAYRKHMHALSMLARKHKAEDAVEVAEKEQEGSGFAEGIVEPQPEHTATQPTAQENAGGPDAPALEINEDLIEKTDEVVNEETPDEEAKVETTPTTSEDKNNGTDSETTGIRGHDEGQGRQKRTWEK
jgi:hypothetical protein